MQVSELTQLSMSGSFLDAPDQQLVSPTPTGPFSALPGSRPSSQSNLLQVPAEIRGSGSPPAVSTTTSIYKDENKHLVSGGDQTIVKDLKSMTPRQRVFQELVQTETNFVNVLKTILEVFKKPLDDPNQIGGQLLNQTQIKIIFGYLPAIYDVHTSMLAEFNDAISKWHDNYSIGGAYLR